MSQSNYILNLLNIKDENIKIISNSDKYAIALDLKNKISEKDIANRYRVSLNTVERIIDSYYEGKTLFTWGIIDNFHIVQLISTSLNKTRINLNKKTIINLKDTRD